MQVEQLRKELSAAALNLDKLNARKNWAEGQIQESAQQISKLEAEQSALSEKEVQIKLK